MEETGEEHGYEAGRHGGQEFEAGVFTCYWVTKQSKQVRWTKPQAHPQFYCTWDRSSADKDRFTIPTGGCVAPGQPPTQLIMYAQPGQR